MPNGTYGGVRGRKTKVGRKLLRFPPTRFCEDACEAPYNDIGYERVVWCHWLMLLLVIIMSNQTAGWQLPVLYEAEPSLKRCSQFPFISVVADTTCTKTFFLENK